MISTLLDKKRYHWFYSATWEYIWVSTPPQDASTMSEVPVVQVVYNRATSTTTLSWDGGYLVWIRTSNHCTAPSTGPGAHEVSILKHDQWVPHPPWMRRGGMLEVGTSRNSSKIHHACSATDTSHPFFALSKGPSSKTIHKIKPWVQLHPFIKHYGSRWFWSGSQQGFILSDVYVSNLDVELELLLRLPWPPKNKLSLARYLIGFSCSTVDGTSSNIILKWWYTMTENEQNPPFPIKSKQCRGCPGNLPFS